MFQTLRVFENRLELMADMKEAEEQFRALKGYQDAMQEGLEAVFGIEAAATMARQPYDIDLKADRVRRRSWAM